jgi:hypothetical protein
MRKFAPCLSPHFRGAAAVLIVPQRLFYSSYLPLDKSYCRLHAALMSRATFSSFGRVGVISSIFS